MCPRQRITSGQMTKSLHSLHHMLFYQWNYLQKQHKVITSSLHFQFGIIMLILFFQLTLSAILCKYITANRSLLVVCWKILSYQKALNTILKLVHVQYGRLSPRVYEILDVPGNTLNPVYVLDIYIYIIYIYMCIYIYIYIYYIYICACIYIYIYNIYICIY